MIVRNMTITLKLVNEISELFLQNRLKNEVFIHLLNLKNHSLGPKRTFFPFLSLVFKTKMSN